MKASARRGAARSLRLKLALWFLAVFSILHALLLVAMVSLRRDLVHRSNQNRVESWTRALIDNILVEKEKVGWNEQRILELIPFEARFVFWLVRDAKGTVIVSHRVPDGVLVPFTSNEKIPGGPLGAVLTPMVGESAGKLLAGARALTLLTQPFRAEGKDYYLQVGLEQAELESVLQPFLDLFLLGVPLASLAALAAAWSISGRAVEPLVALSQAARDVSPSRLGERIALESTEKEVSALQRELNLALERLEAGYRSQEAFISNVSHELKTPIAAIRGLIETMLDDEAMPAQFQRKFLEKTQLQATRLSDLVADLLSIARLESGRAELERAPLDLRTAVLDAAAALTSNAEQRGVRLKIEVPESEVTCSGDPQWLRQLVSNLLGNAIKYSGKGDDVRLRLYEDDAIACIEVADEGIGIEPLHLERIFERFYRVDKARSRDVGGTGLGLSIVKHIAQSHGGRVEVQSTPGLGSIFTIRLPHEKERNQRH
ncbi:MAG: hypothetical protein KC466_06120 [Myxococcales bacterium]|nr:hypothetical protein [Myxococcales bacterium]